MPKGVPGMTIRVLGMGAGDDAGATSTGATSTLDASAYGGPPFEPTIFTNFLVLCCTPVMQVFLINLVLGLVAFAVRSMQWVVFGRLRASEWQVPSANEPETRHGKFTHSLSPSGRLPPPFSPTQHPALPALPRPAQPRLAQRPRHRLIDEP